MVAPMLVAVPATILPAMGALWWLLRRYEGYFEDARVFFSLIAGFFLGLVATAFETVLFPFASLDFISTMGSGRAFLFFVTGYAFFETGAKVLILGLSRFKGRKDTPYYGAALGLGFGAMASLLFVANGVAAANTPQLTSSQSQFALAVAVLVPVGAIFAHGGTGVFIGRGAARNELWRGWIVGTLLQMPILGCYWLLFAPVSSGYVARAAFAAVASVAYGLGLMWIAQSKVLDVIVPPEIKAQIRRAKRAAARGEDVNPKDVAGLRDVPGPAAVAAMAATATAKAEAASDYARVGDERVSLDADVVDLDSEE